MDAHRCPSFTRDLKLFLNSRLTTPLTRATLGDAEIPFGSLDVYHSFKFGLETLGNDIDANLEEQDMFLLNNWASKYSYQTLW
ncbi:hypothetical protein BJ138DRAFT_1188737 [Hygrophoropsis aurantiaca]|uniref:Uncharacterized protein n=1 Tax=Hygrophoropsis aurantiaca TaxID=72124 RepID=A0ACB7ZSR1_9AGAM|nr:hypothetical protein BJ138DRAFT_1188737 [Hygrophoropsis aurantiaca]